MIEGGILGELASLAREAGSVWIVSETEALAERLGEGRFYVVCVGQFKRGKSTLLNALVDTPVLPTGVVPITAAVTVIRYGDRLAARVRFRDRDWEECDPSALGTYVSEEHNPGNEKDVTGVEVFVPSPLLRTGMCFVDTPGIGSVSLANTEATRAFVPHIDAALVVLGADPPITGEELALVKDTEGIVRDVLVVFNKADRQSDTERAEAVRFTLRVLQAALQRPVGPILHVSATERVTEGRPTRDWNRLVERLETLARDSGAELVRGAQHRETTALIRTLLRELDEQRQALVQPIEESERHLASLRRAVADGARSLIDLGHLMSAEQEHLARTFTNERDRFFREALPAAAPELRDAIRRDPTRERDLRPRAIEHAREVTRRWLERWRHEQEPQVQALYQEAESRFVELVNAFQERLVTLPGLEALPRLTVHEGLRTRSRFFYTEMMWLAPASASTWLLDALLPWRRRSAIERDAVDYLGRLLEVNSARIKNDFLERVAQSREFLEREIRDRLQSLAASAERALQNARQAQAAGMTMVETKLRWIDRTRDQVEGLRRLA